jgi:iron complex outermembrane recepter protein
MVSGRTSARAWLIAAAPFTLAGGAWAAPAAGDAAKADATGDMAPIIVTAQRRAQQLDAVPASIQAFGAEQLKQLHVTSTEDLQAVAPSLNISRGYEGVPIYTLRGVGFNTINLSSTSTVGTYTDEVAYAYPFMNSGPVYDMERVEVLKGPQGTLYGRNTTAGLIDFITAKPKDAEEGGLTLEAGNHATFNSEGFINLPLDAKTAIRLAFRSEDSFNGWQHSASRDETLGRIHLHGARLTLTSHPMDGLKVELGVNGWKNNSDTVAGQAIGFTPNTDPASGTVFSQFNTPGLADFIAAHKNGWTANTADWDPAAERSANVGIGQGIAGPLRENDWFVGVRGLIQYDISPSLALVSLTGYNRVSRDANFDWSGAPYDILVQHAYGTVDSVSEELRLTGHNGPADWTVGAYYAHDSVSDNDQTLLGDNANVLAVRGLTLGLGLENTAFNSPGYTVTDIEQSFRTYLDTSNFEVSTRSLFASSDWKLAPGLTLTTGIRYTRDIQTFDGCSRDLNGSMLPNVNVFNRAFFYQAYGVFTAPVAENQCTTFDVASGTFGPVTSRLDEDNLAWRGAIGWQLSRDALFYASVSRGFKAGSTPVNAANISTQDAPAKQEELTSYEIGTKLSLFRRRVAINLAGFYYDYHDKQLSVYFADPIYTTLLRLANIPKSRAYGLDGDATWSITRRLAWSIAGTLLKTEVQDYVGIDADANPLNYSGAAFPLSPTFSGASTLAWDVPVDATHGFRAIVNARYQSSAKTTLQDDPLLYLKPYGLVNATLSYRRLDGRWELSLWARNLTNQYYWVSAATNANTAVRFPGMDRTFGMALKTLFR